MKRPARLRAGARARPGRAIPSLVVTSLLLGGTLTAVGPSPARAQGTLSIEAGAARAFPPSGSEAESATYALLGFVADLAFGGSGGMGVAVYGGKNVDGGGGDWASAILVTEGWQGLGNGLQLGIGSRAYGFVVDAPFPYEAATVEVLPRIRYRRGPMTLLLEGTAGFGGSSLEIIRVVDPLLPGAGRRVRRPPRDLPPSQEVVTSRLENELWHWGGGPEAAVRVGSVEARVGAMASESAGGAYRTAGAEFAGVRRSVSWTLGVQVWDTPEGTELTGGVTLRLSTGAGWTARLMGLRTEPDPLVRTPPGAQGGAIVGRRLASFGGTGTRPPFRLEPVPDGARVHFELERQASEVSVMGDFTLWERVPLEKRGGQWVGEMELAPGTYHFGFVVDGEWFVPPSAPGRVSDEWGRVNATLVVPEPDGDEGEPWIVLKDGGER